MRMKVTYELVHAYEVWTVEVPDDATAEGVLDGSIDVEFICLDDSGSTDMTPVEVSILLL